VSDHGNAFADHRAREFSWSAPHVYLNAASFGPIPARTKRALDQFNQRRWQLELGDPDLVAPLIASREAAARLINATAAEIALTPNTNVAINIAATAVFHTGDERRVILVSDREFPANVYPWLALARQDFDVELVPTDARGFPDEAAMLERIEQGDVAAASVSFVQFASGFRADLAALGAACKRHGTLFVVDAIQGVGAVPLDVRACNIDLLACGGQKWLCSPWGSGFAYIRSDLITQFEPMLPGWLAFEATQDFTRLTDYRYDMLEDARRFETGSLGFQDYVGFQTSVELQLELGIDAIWQHIRALQDKLIEGARSRDVEIVSDVSDERRSGILCIRPRAPEAVFKRLSASGVRCAFRENAIRLAPHWYSTSEDIDAVLVVLDTSLET
jgi:cysteine desulfurase / selenocysteine lyase